MVLASTGLRARAAGRSFGLQIFSSSAGLALGNSFVVKLLS
jgi:hypothetical protein